MPSLNDLNDGGVSDIPGKQVDESHRAHERVCSSHNESECDNDELSVSFRELLAEQQALSRAVDAGFLSMHKRIDELLSQGGVGPKQEDQANLKRQDSKQPAQEPASLMPHRLKKFKRNAKFKMEKARNRISDRRITTIDEDDGGRDQHGSWGSPYNFTSLALHPDSKTKLYWDVLSILVVLYDLFFVPYIFAWSVSGDLAFVKVSAYFVCTFWTFDIPLNFVSGYYNKEAEIERRVSRSALRYFRTWFLLDMILATVDWVTLNLDAKTAPWAFQVQQIFRICKLLVRVPSKIPRMMDLYARLLLRIDKKGYHALLDILRLLFILMLSNHVLACFWYFIGKNPFICASESAGTCTFTWLTHPDMKNRSDLYQYLSALHWCVTQMTPASMEVVPENSGERLVTIIIITIGLLIATSLIATMTSIVTALRVEMDAKLKNTMQLQRFLAQEHVPTETGLLVMRQVKWRLTQKPRVKVSEVTYINLISRSLQAELKFEIHMNYLYHHNFFGTLNYSDQTLTRGVCNMLVVTSMSKDDTLFEELASATSMYFITLGAVRYVPGPDAYEYNKGNAITRIEGTSWCSEPALWLADWVHLGTCVVDMQSEVLSIDAHGLQVAGRRNKFFQYVLDKYSYAFERYCNESPSISDFPATLDPADVFYCLEHADRVSLAEGIINGMQANSSKAQAKKYGLLLDEITAGKCSIAIINGIGVMRTVFLAALRLTLPSGVDPGMFFVSETHSTSSNSPQHYSSGSTLHADIHRTSILCEVAEFDKKSAGYKPKCVMPGTKRREQESAVGAMQRLLNGDLKQLSGLQIDYQNSDDHSFSQLSVTYGLQSRYIKTCFNATMDPEAAISLPTIAAASPHTWNAGNESEEAARQAVLQEKWSWLNKVKAEQRMDVWMDKAQQAEDVLKKFSRIVWLDNGNRLYLWLTPEEMEILQQKEAAEVMKKWIGLHNKEVFEDDYSIDAVKMDDATEDVRRPRESTMPRQATPIE